MTEETLFAEALNLSPEKRSAFLANACSGNSELREAVEALLAAHERSGHILDAPRLDLEEIMPGGTAQNPSGGALDHTARPDDASAGNPSTHTFEYKSHGETGVLIAGRYTLQEKIGEGGMGEVWVAKQSEPVKRKVALKLIKQGMDSRAVLARFEQERHALAMMDHPNIAKVLDAGLTPNGQPFFVMELVNGLTLTKFCDEARLTPRERLELFVSICQAVQHAHQKGIVHRDLKPANILITMIDGRPTPKVIDFGVAKATAGKLTEESLSTQFGAIVGTLEYMSPEQAGFSSEDIDTRADIYSLGVILYEMLTGLRPIDAARLKSGAMTEMIRIIREEEPSKPSTRLSADKSLPSLAAVRQIEPRKLISLLRGELDWLVMKCLEKQRDRRYETVNALARDVQRYLADEAVEARPPSAGYRFQKFVRRNKVQTIATTLVLFSLLAGIAGTTWGLFRAEKARVAEAKQRQLAEAKEREANDERVKAVAAADKERQAKEQAQKNLAFAKKGNEILGSVFTGLDPKANYATIAQLRNALRDNLLTAVKELEGSAIGDPLEVVTMQDTLGHSLLGLGESARAIEVYEKARDTLKAKLSSDDPETLKGINNLALAYKDAGKLDLALPLFEETLKLQKAKLGPDHPDTLTTMNNLGTSYLLAGKLDQAVPLFDETVKLMKTKLGPDHPYTLATMCSLGGAYGKAGKRDQAVPLLEETVKLMKTKLGPDHPYTKTSKSYLANAYRGAGKPDLAIPLFEEDLKYRKATLGPDHLGTLSSMMDLGEVYCEAKQGAKAEPPLRECLAIREKKQPDVWSTFNTRSLLGGALLGQKKYTEAEPLLMNGYAGMKAREKTIPFSGKMRIPEALDRLIEFYIATNKPEAAAKWRKELDEHNAANPQFMALNDRLAKVLKGEAPNDNAERLSLAKHAFAEKQFAAAAQLWSEALKADATLASDRSAEYRTKAARATVLAASGQGKAGPLIEEDAKSKLRKQALDWLNGELNTCKRVAMSIEPGDKDLVAQALARWKEDTALSSVRDEVLLAKLPEAERKPWLDLWAEVDAVLAKTSK